CRLSRIYVAPQSLFRPAITRRFVPPIRAAGAPVSHIPPLVTHREFAPVRRRGDALGCRSDAQLASGTSCPLAGRRLAQSERRRLAQWCPGSVGTAVVTATRRCRSGGDLDRHWPAATAADEHVARLTKPATYVYHEY